MDINRKTAYTVLLKTEKEQAYSNLELNRQIQLLKPDNPPFVRELVYGVLENKIYLDHILSSLIPKGLRGIKKQVLTLLRMGLYQIIFMDSVPSYAAASETVKLAKKLTPGRDGFINGVLRGYEKKKETIVLPDRSRNLIEYLSVRYSYTEWIVKLWLSIFGEEKTERLLAAGNERPDISVRVNFLKTDRKSLASALEKQGFQTKESSESSRVLLVKGSGLLDTVQYREGYFSMQDTASVLAAEALCAKPGETVLDICAAPGGKSLALAEIMENTGLIRSFDIYRHKLSLLEREAERLGISIVETEENDGCAIRSDLSETADCVLVDGPCSGLGVIRRKPEIKYKEISDDGASLAEKQLRILTVSSRYVKPGGILQYSTCTVNRLENEDVVRHFLENHREFVKVFERQLLPDTDAADGFYICRMEKRGIVKGEYYGGRL